MQVWPSKRGARPRRHLVPGSLVAKVMVMQTRTNVWWPRMISLPGQFITVTLTIDRSHVTTAIWWPLGVAVVSVTCMRVRCVSHTWKYIQWNIFLFESSDKSPYWTNPYHIGFRYEASLNFHTYFGQCPNDIYILLHIPLSCLSKLPAHGASDCHGP